LQIPSVNKELHQYAYANAHRQEENRMHVEGLRLSSVEIRKPQETFADPHWRMRLRRGNHCQTTLATSTSEHAYFYKNTTSTNFSATQVSIKSQNLFSFIFFLLTLIDISPVGLAAFDAWAEHTIPSACYKSQY
jgi:hypothetical protein